MKLFLITTAFSMGAAFAGLGYATSQATPVIEEARYQKLSAYCEAGLSEACEILTAEETTR